MPSKGKNYIFFAVSAEAESIGAAAESVTAVSGAAVSVIVEVESAAASSFFSDLQDANTNTPATRARANTFFI